MCRPIRAGHGELAKFIAQVDHEKPDTGTLFNAFLSRAQLC